MESSLRMVMEGSSTPTLPCSDFTQPQSSRKSPIKTKKDRKFRASSGIQSDVALKGEITSNKEMDIVPSLSWLSQAKPKHEQALSASTKHVASSHTHTYGQTEHSRFGARQSLTHFHTDTHRVNDKAEL